METSEAIPVQTDESGPGRQARQSLETGQVPGGQEHKYEMSEKTDLNSKGNLPRPVLEGMI